MSLKPIKLTTATVFIVLFTLLQPVHAQRFWVGGSGNWSDSTRWSLTSGGVGGASVPGAGDNVFFDANSNGPGTAAFNVVLNVPAVVNQLSFTGTDGLATFSGTNSLTVNGTVTTTSNWNPTFTGRFILAGNIPFTTNNINFTGQIFSGGIQVFGNVDGAGWQATAGTINTTGNILISRGILNLNGRPVTAQAISANDTNHFDRSLLMGASVVTLNGSGTIIDFTDNLGVFTLDPGTSVVNMATTGGITIACGNSSKTMPILNSTASGSSMIIQATGNLANTTTLQAISSVKTTLTFSGNGSTSFNGTITVPTSSSASFGGRNLQFNSNLLEPSNCVFSFTNVGTTTFNGTLTTASGSTLTFTNSMTTGTFNAPIVFGGTSVAFSNSGSNTFATTAPITQNTGTVSFSNNGNNYNGNITLGQNVIWRFSNVGVSNLAATNELRSISLCGTVGTYPTVNSVTGTASLNIATPRTWYNLRVGGLNVTGSLIVSFGSVNLGGNTNVTFGTVSDTRVIYWVGGSGNWNDQNRWSTFSGGPGGECTPGSADSVVFDANSFSSAGTVTLNVAGVVRDIHTGGLSQNVNLSGVTSFTVSRSAIFSPNLTVAVDPIIFTSSTTAIFNPANATINSRIQISKSSGSLDFTGTLNSIRSLTVINGSVNTNANTLSVQQLTLNAPSGSTLNFQNSIINISGNAAGTDLTLATVDLTTNLNLSGSTININGVVETDLRNGNKTLHNINVASSGNFTLTTDPSPTVYSFNNITVASDGTIFEIGLSRKIFNNVTLGANASFTMRGTNNTYNGTVTVSSMTIAGRNIRFDVNSNVFNGPVLINGPVTDSDRVHFYNSRFNSTVTLASNGGRAQFRNNCYFAGAVDIQNDLTASDPTGVFYGTDTFATDFNQGNGSIARFTVNNTVGTRTVFLGPVTIGNNIDIGNCDSQRDIEFYQDVNIGNNTTFQFCASFGASTFRQNLTIGTNSQVRLRRFVYVLGRYFQGSGGNAMFSEFSDTAYFRGRVEFVGNHSFNIWQRQARFDSALVFGNNCNDVRFNEAANSPNICYFYGPVTIGNGGTYIFRRGSQMFSDFTAGNNLALRFTETDPGGGFGGRSTVIRGNVVIGTGGSTYFRHLSRFLGRFTKGSGGDIRFSTSNDSTYFAGQVSFEGNTSQIQFNRTVFFDSALTIGNTNANIVINDASTNTPGSLFSRFRGNVTIGSGSAINIHRRVQFFGTLIIGDNSTLQTNLTDGGSAITNTSTFSDTVRIGNTCTANFIRITQFASNLIFGNNCTVNLNASGGSIEFNSAPTSAIWQLGTNCVVTFNPGAANTIRNFNLGPFTRVIFNNNGVNNTFRTINFTRFVTIFFNTLGGVNAITNGITGNNTCGSWNYIRTNVPNRQTEINLGTASTVDEFVAQDINSTGSLLTINSGVNLVNNTGAITFTSVRTPRTYFWVRGTNNTQLWSDSTNWSLTSGVTISPTAGQCIPSPVDSVVFDNNSFNGTRRTVNIDLLNVFCKGMHWTTGITNNPELQGIAQNTLNVDGELTMPAGLMTITFAGTTQFGAAEVGVKRINTNGVSFNGPILFNSQFGNWLMTSNFFVGNGFNGNITFRRGNVNANTTGVRIALQGSWTVEAANAPAPAPTFTAGISTVEFFGATSGVDIITRGNDFYNLTVNKTNNGDLVEVRNNAIVVRNDLRLERGQLTDAGNGFDEGSFQISGNTTGSGLLLVTNNATLHIGRSGAWAGAADDGTVGNAGSPGVGATNNTTFPTGWNTAQCSLEVNSRVIYRRHGFQPVSGVPNYGILELLNPVACGAGCPRMRYATGPLTVFGQMILRNGIVLADSGHQITFSASTQLVMENFAELVLGRVASRTLFPMNFVTANMNLDANSTVVYNSGVSGGPNIQDIASLAGGGNNSYGNLVIRNSISYRGTAGALTILRETTGSHAEKRLIGNIIVRGNLTIENRNSLDVTTGNFQIDLRGNWIGQTDSRFESRGGTVLMSGGNAQTIAAGSSQHDFNVFQINKSGNNVTLNTPVFIVSRVDFTNRYIVATSANHLFFRDNAVVGTGGNAPRNASHVIGWVRKEGNDAFTFPVGNGQWYRAIGISAPADATTVFASNYVRAFPQGSVGSPLDISLRNISVLEYWNLDRIVNAGGGNSAAQVTLSWVDIVSGGVRSFDSLVVVRWNGAQWANSGPAPGVANRTGNDFNGTVTTSAALDAFSPFTLGSVSRFIFNPLPVNLVSFNVTQSATSAVCSWKVTEEQEVREYQLERSTDGRQFTNIATVSSQKAATAEYRHVDTSPKQGWNYYRLKTIEDNGEEYYSSIVSIYFENGRGFELSLYPNPVTDGTIKIKATQGAANIRLLNIVDELGRVINLDLNNNQAFVSEIQLDLAEKLASGIYFAIVEVEGGQGQTGRLKFIVK